MYPDTDLTLTGSKLQVQCGTYSPSSSPIVNLEKPILKALNKSVGYSFLISFTWSGGQHRYLALLKSSMNRNEVSSVQHFFHTQNQQHPAI